MPFEIFCLSRKHSKRDEKSTKNTFWNDFYHAKSFSRKQFFHDFWCQKFLNCVIWYLENWEISQLSCPVEKFKWSTYQFHIFPPQRKSISIKRTNSHAHTTPTSEVSAEKLKFDSASYRFKITMFICKICESLPNQKHGLRVYENLSTEGGIHWKIKK